MARVFVTDSSVADLVARLADAFVREGSVNALQRALIGVLEDNGHSEKLYPNRLHALLSADPTRSVNEETIRVLRLALDSYVAPPSHSTVRDTLRARVISALGEDGQFLSGSPDQQARRLSQVADATQLPPAVVRYVLGDTGRAVASTGFAGGTPSVLVSNTPDWSYQDDACRNSVRALKRDVSCKVGLVLPTGAGKTRVAMRIVLRILDDDTRKDSVVLWVTHRHFLSAQANRELQRAIREGTAELPETAVRLLRTRVEFVMVSQLEERLRQLGGRVALVVVDEAHHAAAPSYRAVFDEPGHRALFLTATPNRTDQRAIGIGEIAYTTTYRDLFARGVLIEPSFEPPIPVLDVSSPSAYLDLADYLLERSRNEFVKTIVVVSRVEAVERLYNHVLERLAEEGDHLLEADDIGFAHGLRTSTGRDVLSFLDEFAARERGVLISTAQLLGEGFDDPKINAVVLTYGTSSMSQLMQVAGRCLRYSPGKTRAYVVQATASDLAYHFEQRWLYQDIADRLHPIIRDYEYGTLVELREQVEQLLAAHHVAPEATRAVFERLDQLERGEEFSVLLSGLPYDGSVADFESSSSWSALPVSRGERERFLAIFNEYSECVHEDRDAKLFLRQYVEVDPRDGSDWSLYRTLLHGMDYAWREIENQIYWGREHRPYIEARGTSWLIYVTFRQGGVLPTALDAFLDNVVNRHVLAEQFLCNPHAWAGCVKVDLPIGGAFGFLLDPKQWEWLTRARAELLAGLVSCPPEKMHGWVEGWKLSAPPAPGLPALFLHRLDAVVSTEGADRLTLALVHTI